MNAEVAPRAKTPLAERAGVFELVVAVSVVLHAGAVALLPTSRTARAAPAVMVVEVAELTAPPPPVAPPPETPPEASPEQPLPRPKPRGNPTAAASRAPSTPSRTAPSAAEPGPEVPVDFTSTVLSSADGPGVAISQGPLGAARTSGRGAAGSGGAAAPAAGPRLVALGDLSSAPVPPALDRALANNYPPEARRSGISGTALLRVRILPDGRVGAVRRVSETYPGFGEACARTVRSAAWTPPVDRAGRRVATELTYRCRFEVGR